MWLVSSLCQDKIYLREIYYASLSLDIFMAQMFPSEHVLLLLFWHYIFDKYGTVQAAPVWRAFTLTLSQPPVTISGDVFQWWSDLLYTYRRYLYLLYNHLLCEGKIVTFQSCQIYDAYNLLTAQKWHFHRCFFVVISSKAYGVFLSSDVVEACREYGNPNNQNKKH